MKAYPGKNPDPPKEPADKTYEVVGPNAVHGAAPGSLVTLRLSKSREDALIRGGHLAVHKPAPTPKPPSGAKGAK